MLKMHSLFIIFFFTIFLFRSTNAKMLKYASRFFSSCWFEQKFIEFILHRFQYVKCGYLFCKYFQMSSCDEVVMLSGKLLTTYNL